MTRKTLASLTAELPPAPRTAAYSSDDSLGYLGEQAHKYLIQKPRVEHAYKTLVKHLWPALVGGSMRDMSAPKVEVGNDQDNYGKDIHLSRPLTEDEHGRMEADLAKAGFKRQPVGPFIKGFRQYVKQSLTGPTAIHVSDGTPGSEYHTPGISIHAHHTDYTGGAGWAGEQPR